MAEKRNAMKQRITKPNSLFIPAATVFISSFCIMVLELVASRLIARYLGSSLYTWTAVIGVVLAGITVGNYVGGRLADRRPRESMLFQLIAWAGFAIGLIPFISKPILRYAVIGFAEYRVGLLAGSLLAVILLFAVPVTV